MCEVKNVSGSSSSENDRGPVPSSNRFLVTVAAGASSARVSSCVPSRPSTARPAATKGASFRPLLQTRSRACSPRASIASSGLSRMRFGSPRNSSSRASRDSLVSFESPSERARTFAQSQGGVRRSGFLPRTSSHVAPSWMSLRELRPRPRRWAPGPFTSPARRGGTPCARPRRTLPSVPVPVERSGRGSHPPAGRTSTTAVMPASVCSLTWQWTSQVPGFVSSTFAVAVW